MKLQRSLSVFAAVLMFSAVALPAQPFMGPGGPPGREHGRGPFGPEDRFERMADRLDLSKEQESRGKAIHDKYNKQIQELWDEIAEMHEKLRTTLEGKSVDLNDVRSQLQKIADKQVEMRMLFIQRHLEFEKILTDEQKEEWKSWMQRHRDRFYKKGAGSRR